MEFRNISFNQFLLLSLIAAILVHMGCLIYVRVTGHSIQLSTELLISLLLSYIILVAQITLFGRAPGSKPRAIVIDWLWANSSMDQNMRNLLNIVLFVPLGVLLHIILKHESHVKSTLMITNYCFLMSILIESTQYITRRGYTEIVDIQANVIGGLLGSLFVCLCSKIGRIIHKNAEE